MPRFGLIFLVFALVFGSGLVAACKRRQIEGNTQAEAQHLFDSTCAICHGRDGRGGVPASEGLPPPRNFRDEAFQASRTDAELKRVIREGKGPMPAFAALFDDSQLDLLVAYVRTYDPRKAAGGR